MKSNYFFIILIVLIPFIGFSQKTTQQKFVKEYLVPLKQYNLELVKERKVSLEDTFLLSFVICQIEKFEKGQISTNSFNHLSNIERESDFNEILFLILSGDYKKVNEPAASIRDYQNALNLANNINSKELSCEVLKRLCSYFISTQDIKHSDRLKNLLSLYKKEIYDDIEIFFFEYYNLIYKMQVASTNLNNIKKDKFYNLLKLAKKTKNNILEGNALQLLGAYYLVFEKKQDSTLFYHLKAKEKFYSSTEAAFYKHKHNAISLNLIKNAIQAGNLQNLITTLEAIDTGKDFRMKLSKHQFLKEVYIELSDYKNAYLEQKREKQINDSLNHLKLAEINTKYEVDRKEQENITLKKDKKNLLIGSITGLTLIGFIAFLIQKNTRKKQKLAEQEKALETQKLATVLKEQELIAIDAMIEGQEKERQRIANDLHDDLGGLMATVKLHFNALNNEKKAGKLFEKTNDLLDEAYNKIRSIAHAKNSGVIAKQGLLIAVQNMADKISVSNKINIEVIDHGLENRLENSLELTIFRIIQELVTNIIKHAEATEANIHLTNHDNTINIMIEDNGKGFNPNQVTTKHKGMGINSIDKRVEHLDGKMTIESELNKGTTIIIDIPL